MTEPITVAYTATGKTGAILKTIGETIANNAAYQALFPTPDDDTPPDYGGHVYFGIWEPETQDDFPGVEIQCNGAVYVPANASNAGKIASATVSIAVFGTFQQADTTGQDDHNTIRATIQDLMDSITNDLLANVKKEHRAVRQMGGIQEADAAALELLCHTTAKTAYDNYLQQHPGDQAGANNAAGSIQSIPFWWFLLEYTWGDR